MRGVVQRVSRARVETGGGTVGEIGAGILLLAGFTAGDTGSDMEWMLDKVVNLRIFEDSSGRMNLSLMDTGGELLLVPQFTLYGDCRRGRRPSFSDAAPPDMAARMFTEFLNMAGGLPVKVESGVFQADMAVELVNQGPVTLLLDSKKNF